MGLVNDFPTLEEYNVKLAGASGRDHPPASTPTPQPVSLAKPGGRPGAGGSGKPGTGLPRDMLDSMESIRTNLCQCILNNDSYEPDSALN